MGFSAEVLHPIVNSIQQISQIENNKITSRMKVQWMCEQFLSELFACVL